MNYKFIVFCENHAWGLGDTKEQALEDGKQWYRETGKDFEADFALGTLNVAPCSDSLASYVDDNSGENVKLILDAHGNAIRLEAPPVDKFH